jgi:hypothetical protein
MGYTFRKYLDNADNAKIDTMLGPGHLEMAEERKGNIR